MGFTHCRHYNGLELFHGTTGGKCRAGVDPIYSFCGGERLGWLKKAPCMPENNSDAVCPAADYPTLEEARLAAKEFEEWADKQFKIIGQIRPAIVKAHKETGASTGSIECPQCSGNLRWSRARSNGHIHAACETEGCLSWME